MPLTADFPIAVHPGDVLREMLQDLGITQANLARHLRVDVGRINDICRRRSGISARMAVLLSAALGTTVDVWMNLQKNWEVSRVDRRCIRSIRSLRASA